MNPTTLTAIGECVALLVAGYGSVAAKRARDNTKNISNGFASHTESSLNAIQAHLAAQDVATVKIVQTLDRHEKMLTELSKGD